MKVKSLDVLQKYGFLKLEGELREIKCLYWSDALYVFVIGHSRRGQLYFLLVDSSLILKIQASEADGEGCEIEVPNVILEMFKNGDLTL